ncbi:ribosome assembly RNA-binding protein YhbY [Acidithiobacillus sp. AMEEHan]|uniref:ribosome assembly RNA-binding protein YhbY n=1 Tax=Acidithiobacillus sp. AMEEHan TaxID=2994951 RepID=UPI0027E590A2|nr:ribosome assembly RNA-binding protein YhbY [Acidithiobacillus sp. AMEEHan]
MLDSKARQELRARAHHLKPIILVGASGVTETLLRELDRALFDHELLKVRLPALDKEDRDAMVESLVAGSGAEAVGRVGRILMLYRPRPSNGIFIPYVAQS